MVKLLLRAGQEHVADLTHMHDPLGAVEELVWNALDADADNVVIELDTNVRGQVERVVVSDDGTGMAAERCAHYFLPMGASWKRSAGVTPVKKRVLHGRNGQGRIRAFALGSEVRWTSVSEGGSGRRQVVIESDRRTMHEFDVSEPEPTGAPLGTVFEALGGGGRSGRLTERTAVTTLTAALATHLTAYPDIRVVYDGVVLDPVEARAHAGEYPLASAGDAERRPVLKVVEWKRPVDRALILCDERGMSLARLDPEVEAPGFHFTAYLSWPGFDEDPHDPVPARDRAPAQGEAAVRDRSVDGTHRVIAAAREQLRAHFRLRAEERRQSNVREWRVEGIYPYDGDPADSRERVERETFDLVATTVVRHLPSARKTRRMVLGFLRTVLTHDPAAALRVVEDVFPLTPQETDDLSRLLDRTPLSSLIRASAEATARMDFLGALGELVAEPGTRQGRPGERARLHRILENECWVFGEEYGLHAGERSLDEVLRRHCSLLGRDTPVPGPALREEARSGIVDLLLARSARHRRDGRSHLVVELKGPDVVLGMAELGQVTSFAQAVRRDERFREAGVVWDFWLVGHSMDDNLRQMAQQRDREPGCVVDRPTYRVWVRAWADIIAEGEERLRFYRDRLEQRAVTERAVDHLIPRGPEADTGSAPVSTLTPLVRASVPAPLTEPAMGPAPAQVREAGPVPGPGAEAESEREAAKGAGTGGAPLPEPGSAPDSLPAPGHHSAAASDSAPERAIPAPRAVPRGSTGGGYGDLKVRGVFGALRIAPRMGERKTLRDHRGGCCA
ncbi:ATP-binding protein [Streptomyces sp. AM 4-1-1]|uniref:ATP-binding protein n=1 Tax=Streptomyces sp. AM 4-1-1 TaxID=3028710 RepID=UPI0023B9B28E|nr:ATP-binding protein [Streptomyces sp. AM 4-1-1]WEH35863.1 ATP-binding protein [Streptomyces sp. AM 4-1-1]